MKQLVKNGDFSEGEAGFGSDYTSVTGAPGSQVGTYPAYNVGRNPDKSPSAESDWSKFGDHTSGDGKMLILNGGPGDLWRENIHLAAGKTYTFDLWARHCLDGSNGLGNLPQLQFFADGHAIGSSLTVQGPDTVGWQELTFSLTPTTSTTVVSIQDATTDQAYNDFCVDDISIIRNKAGTSASGSLAEHLHADAFAISHSAAHLAFVPMHGAEHLAIA